MWTLLLLAGLASASPDPAREVIPRSTAQLAAVSEAERIGRDIYDFDQAAWGSTDALIAAMPNYTAAGIKGWIVEREGGGTVAIYYGWADEHPYKIFVAHMQGRTVTASHVLGPTEDRGMTQIEERMVAARTAGLTQETLAKAGIKVCTSGSINTVVLPPPTATAPVPVYILTPQSSNDSFPIGGHYRIDIAADGSIASSRGFAKSCIAMDRPKGSSDPQMFVVTHLLDPQPTEIHAWISLAGGLPLAVVIVPSRDLWIVQNGRMKYAYTLPAPQPKK